MLEEATSKGRERESNCRVVQERYELVLWRFFSVPNFSWVESDTNKALKNEKGKIEKSGWHCHSRNTTFSVKSKKHMHKDKLEYALTY